MVTVEFKRLDVKSGFRILDIGCGSGRHTCAAYQHQDVVAIGADLNFNDLIEARNRLKLHDQLGEHGGGVWGLSMADVTNLPFKDNYFDLVICSEVLEHIPRYELAILEIIRVLQPDCNLVVSVPRSWTERICWLLSSEYVNIKGGHLRIFNKQQLISDLENAGVKQWGLHFAHSLHSPFWWLKCLVGLNRDDSLLVNLYHRFLTWDIMKQPRATRFLDNLLNPILGKSIVLYLRKE
jgi:SAM-dependent methyltransferase